MTGTSEQQTDGSAGPSPAAGPTRAPFVDAAGRVTDHAIDIFTTEYCWYLAWLLHARTGWPMVAVSENTLPVDGGTGWNHVLVEHPNGQYLDVTGLSDDHDVFDLWAIMLEMDMDEGGEAILETIDADMFRVRLSSDPDDVPDELRVATEALVTALLRQIEVPAA